MRAFSPFTLIVISMFVVGCGTHSNEESLAKAGCKIDAAAACASAKGQTVGSSSGQQSEDPKMLQENSNATEQVFFNIHFPSGDPDMTINCNLKARTQSVVYAEIAPGPALSDKDIDYLRGAGYCSP